MKATSQSIDPPSPSPSKAEPIRRYLVVMDHHEARIFRTEKHGANFEQIRPHQTDEAIRHKDSSASFSRGQEKPAPSTFFGPIADALKDASQLLIFGGGTGMANEMEQFSAWLKTHRPNLAKRIVGTVVVNAHHLTDDQLLALAREFYSKPEVQAAPAD